MLLPTFVRVYRGEPRNSDYYPPVIQRALAGYLKTAAMSAGEVGDSPLFLLEYALRLLRVLVLIALWRTILEGRPGPGPMGLASVVTYTLMSSRPSRWMACRAWPWPLC
jgi:hypothetical protein